MGEVLAIISAWFFSSGNVFMRRGMRPGSDNGVFMATFVNMIVFSGLLLILHYSGRLPELTCMGFFLFVVAGLLTTYGGRSLLYAAVRAIGPSRAVAYRASSPIFTVCLAFVFLSERFSLTQAVGICAVIAGVWSLSVEAARRSDLAVGTVGPSGTDGSTRGSRAHGTFERRSLAGIIFGLGSSATFGTGHFVRKLAVMEVPSPYWGVAIGTTAGWLAMVLHATVRRDIKVLCRDNFNFHAPPWFFIVSGFFMAAGQLFVYLSIYMTAVSIAMVLASSEPLATLVISRLFLGREEPLNWRVVLSAIAVFLGIVFVLL